MWKQLESGDVDLLRQLDVLNTSEIRATTNRLVSAQRQAGRDDRKIRSALFRSAYQSCLANLPELGRLLYEIAWETDASVDMSVVPNALVAHALSYNPIIQTQIAAVCAASKVIYITGCARSGTTLTLRCVGATAAKAHVFWREAWISSVRDVTGAATIVLKRSGVDHCFFAKIPSEAHVLHVVRHPADTCTSRMPGREGYYVSSERWLAEHEAAKRLLADHPNEKLMVLRYEDLLAHPDQVQTKIAAKWGLEFDLPFSRYDERNDRDTSLDRNGNSYVWPPIARSAGYRHLKTNEDAERVATFTAGLGTAYAEFCNMFGYDMHDEKAAVAER